MAEQPTQEQLLGYFADYVSPQKVRMYQMWGVDFVPGRREGVREDMERLRLSIDGWAREAGAR